MDSLFTTHLPNAFSLYKRFLFLLPCGSLPVAHHGCRIVILYWCHWRTDTEAEAPILWPPDAKSQLTGKNPDAGKDWRQEEKGMTEDEMVGWHHQFNGHEFEQALGNSEGQGSLACCSPWGCKESEMTEQLNNWCQTNSSLLRNIWQSVSGQQILTLITLENHCSGSFIFRFSSPDLLCKNWGLLYSKVDWILHPVLFLPFQNSFSVNSFLFLTLFTSWELLSLWKSDRLIQSTEWWEFCTEETLTGALKFFFNFHFLHFLIEG